MTVVQSLMQEEGFSGTVYKDTEGFDTILYGIKLPLTEEEGTLILQHRLYAIIKELDNHIDKPIYNLPQDKKDILYEMAYQIGVPGLLRFKKMWKALESNDYEKAAIEMEDSRWHKQTTNRANRLITRMKG